MMLIEWFEILKIEFLEKFIRLSHDNKFRKLSLKGCIFRQELVQKENIDNDDGKGARISIVF